MNRFLSWLDPAPARLIPGAILIALYAAVAADAPLAAPIRVLIAALALALWPGAMLLRFLLVGREVEWPGRIAYGFALGLGLACAFALAAHLGRFDYGAGLWALPALGLGLACIRPAHPVETPDARGLLPWLLVAGWALLVAAVFGTLGAPLMSNTDSPDHIATVRRMVETREVFPTDAFFTDAGPYGADPRKGLYHAWVALVSRASHVDPVGTWQMLPLLLIPIFVIAIYVCAYALTESRMTGVVAAVLFPLLYGGGPGGTELREAVYSTRVGEMVALLAVAALVRQVEGGRRRRLVLFWATAGTAIAVHVWYALYFALGLGVYAVGVALARRSGTEIRRLAAALVGLVALTGPYLAFRAREAYGPSNVIHTEPQGLLRITERLFVVDPGGIWAWSGIWLVVALLAAPWLWSRRRASTGAIYLALVPAAVLAIVFNPWLLPLVEAKLGYLTMRLIWLAPVIPVVALVIVTLGAVLLRRRGAPGAAAGATLIVLLVLLAPSLREAASVVIERDRLIAQEEARGPGPIMDLLSFLSAHFGERTVFLSDPATSYAIPAYTGHAVSAYLDQHSSPNDPKGLERILDARDALSPYVGLDSTLSILREYGVDAVVLNQRFGTAIRSNYWTVTPVLYDATREKFERHPESFRRVWTAPGAAVYELTEAARSGPLPGAPEPPRPHVLARDPGLLASPIPDGDFLQHGTTIVPARPGHGDTLDLVTYWSVTRSVPAGSYMVYVRFDTEAPKDGLYSEAYGKIHRKLLERWTGVRYRLRDGHVPLGGVLGPDRWRPGEIVEDRHRFVIPLDAAPGRYTVRVKMLRLPHYPNLWLRDYLRDDDLFSGPPVGTVELKPDPSLGSAR